MEKSKYIINNTLTLVDEVGLDNISMRKIAEHCNMPLSSLYTHYKSKNELLNAMFEYSLEKSFPKISSDEFKTPEEFFNMTFCFVFDNKIYYKFVSLYANGQFLSEESRKDLYLSICEKQRELKSKMSSYFKEETDYKAFSYVVHGLIKEIVIRDDITKEEIKSIVDIILNGVLKGE